MALSKGLRCCQRVFSWIPVIIITSVGLWSYYAYVFELCLFTITKSFEKVAYLLVFHICFGMFSWTYWKAIFTPPSSPCNKFQLSYINKEHYEMEERPDAQKQILVEIAKNLPIFTRAASGGLCRSSPRTKWEMSISFLIKKGQQRMYFLRQLKKFNMERTMMVHVYAGFITSSLTMWFSYVTSKDKRRLQHIVPSAEKVICLALRTLRLARKILGLLPPWALCFSHPPPADGCGPSGPKPHATKTVSSTFSYRL